jgi:hypothetical protein
MFAVLSLFLSMFALTARPVSADGEGSPTACLDTTAGVTGSINSTSDDLATFTAESGEVVTGVCIKAGNYHSDVITANGAVAGTCFVVAGIGTPTVTVTRSGSSGECSGLSHIDVVTADAPTPTLTVEKQTVGGDDDFQFTLDDVNVALLSDDESAEVATAAGNYDLAEVLSQAQIDAGWTLTSINCEGNAVPEVVTDASVNVTVGADEDVKCVFTNTLVERNGELEVDKFNCTGAEDDTLFFVFGPFSVQSHPDTTDCTIGAGVTFSVYTDAGEGVPGDFVLEATTDAEGIIEVDLAEGNYVLVEGAQGVEGPSQAFTIEADSVTAIVVLNVTGEENGEVKILKFLCPGEEDAVHFFEEGDESIPDVTECEVADATFTIDDGEEFTTENGGAIRTVTADVEHTLAEVSPLTGSTTFTVAEDERVTIIVINFEGEDETLGSVTVNKEIECEVCETFTPGFFFNRGENNEGTAFTNANLPSNQVTIAGETFGDLTFGGNTYDSAVQEINAYLAADRSGDLDGEKGLSAQGQLVRQFLALYLNFAFGGEGCDLANAIYTGSVELPGWVDADESGDVTVHELLDAAQSATDEAEMRAIAEAIDEVNNSGDGDAPVVLDCPEGTEGTAGAGFSFELYGPDDTELLADSGTTDETGSLLLDGDPDESGLTLGTYLLVETTNEGGLECTITDVIVDGEGSAVLNEDGTVTITLTEEAADISITVVNECEREGGGQLPDDETVTVSIMKHLCTDVTNVEQFEAVENAGVAGIPGGEGTLSGLAATVLACPTIVLTGDVPTAGAVSGGQVDFDFTVVDASGTQVLSTDGDFEAAALCETTIDIDVNSDGDKGDCLDVSHYMFEVVDGVVVITETQAPAGSSGVGTLRFTPGSEDETALATSIETVESTGVITLDTTQASDTALEDGMIMLHVYNFAAAEGTQGGGGGPRGGTLSGTLPNTATDPITGSVPAVIVALTMLAGLGFGGYRMAEEARRRR